jgi:hypothetical protein
VTRHELSVAKPLPMKAHLTLDGRSGAALATAPWLMLDDATGARMAIASMGAFEIAAALLTQTQPPVTEQAKRPLRGQAA